MRAGSPVSDRSKPSGPGAPGTVTSGFRPLADDTRWDHQPIYRIVEVFRDGAGRLHKQGCVWHNDLDMLRRFGRAVAANTASHKVLITNSQGDVVEELPVALPEHRHSAWNAWGSIALPPAPPVRKARRASDATPPPRSVVLDDQTTATESAPPENTPSEPPRDIPKLPVDQATGTLPALPEHVAALP